MFYQAGGIKKKAGLPKTVSVWSPINDVIIPIDISIIQDTASCGAFEDDPDVIAVPIDNKWLPSLNTVEKYITPPFKAINTVDIFGYPLIKNLDLPTGFRASPPSHIHLPKRDYSFSYNFRDTTHLIDSFNYRLYTNSIHFDSSLEGYSGSPVFVQDSASKNWRVMGMLNGWGIQRDNQSFGYILLIDYASRNIHSRVH